MELAIILISILVIIILIIIMLIVKINNNKFKIYNIKIDKSLKKIDNSLKEKFNLMLKTIEFLHKNITINEDELQEFLNINIKKIDIYELNNILMETENILNKYLDQNEKLINNNEYMDIKKTLDDLNIIINAAKKYCNDNIKEYNKLIKKSLSSIVAKIYKYKPKDKFKEVKKEKLKILN